MNFPTLTYAPPHMPGHYKYNFIIFLLNYNRVIAQACTHPMDVMKVRMQVTRANLSTTISQTYSTSGIAGFYVGLTPALLRQLTYTTSRLGLYNTLLDVLEYLEYIHIQVCALEIEFETFYFIINKKKKERKFDLQSNNWKIWQI